MHTNTYKLEYDYIECYVGMARMVAFWHAKTLGFKVIGYCGPETGVPEKVSYFLQKNDIKLVITSAAQPSSYDIVSFVDLHGNGVKRLAIRVDDVATFYQKAVTNGAIPIREPFRKEDKHGFVEQAYVKLFDDNEIAFINADQYHGLFMPGYQNVAHEWEHTAGQEDTLLTKIDHIACALRENEMRIWESYLHNMLDATTVQEFGQGDIATNKSGLILKVLQNAQKSLNKVLVEPDNKEKKSQIQVFIDKNFGTGIQHVAFASEDIFTTVKRMREGGMIFTSFPDSYYDLLREKHPHLNVDKIQECRLLCDVEDDALLLQTFTTPIGDRPTLFYEVVQRVNDYEGFGLGNINTLFEAVEKDLEQV
ncbi:MAG: 4-hydroxyphenylpyruvate dioxygenase [Flammeovirgaceae bacterium]